MTEVEFETLNVEQAGICLDDLVACYMASHDDANPFHSEDRFRQQITGHMKAPAWQVVIAKAGEALVGFIYGFALAPDTRWWRGLVTEMPHEFTVEDGSRTVAISELMVRPDFRRQGLARELHDRFLAGRAEARATLLVRAENAAAQQAYAAWGWSKTAELRPTSWDDAPLFDVLVRSV